MLRSASLFLLLLTGCSETGLRPDASPSDGARPRIQFVPPAVDLGTDAPGRDRIAELELVAVGGAVALEGLTLDGTDFALLDAPEGLLLERDERVPVDVVFSGRALGTHTARLQADSDVGPAHATIRGQIALVEPDISASTDVLQMESGSADSVLVSSVGAADLEVFTVELQDAPGFRLRESPELPATLTPGQAVEIAVQYEGMGDEGHLVITSDDPDEPALRIALIGLEGDDGCASIDADGDGSNLCDDCDDEDPGRAPHLAEICNDGIDQDCDELDATDVTLALLPGWGNGSTDSNLIWPSFEDAWSTHGECAVNLVDVPPGFDLDTLIDADATSLVITDPAGNSIVYTEDESAAIRAFAEEGHGGIIVTYLLSWDGWSHGDLWDNRALADLVGVQPTAIGTAHAEGVANRVQVMDPAHPLNDGLGSSYQVTPYAYAQGRTTTSWSAGLLPGASVVAEATDGHMATIAYEGPGWRGVFFTGMADYQSGAPQAMYNAAVWTGAK